jgi:SHS2 domain-containing protein
MHSSKSRLPLWRKPSLVPQDQLSRQFLTWVPSREKRRVAYKNYLLYNWLEELIILTITDGFATKSIKLRIEKNSEYRILADLIGEDIDIKKHHFKVEIKAPTFHLMEIKQDGGVQMRYLLDL